MEWIKMKLARFAFSEQNLEVSIYFMLQSSSKKKVLTLFDRILQICFTIS